MRIFLRYNPLMIAKYVKILFRGKLYIKGIGTFEFDRGRILLPKTKDRQQLNAMTEINRQVLRLQAECYAL